MVGGKLTEAAIHKQRTERKTVQELFKEAAYQPDEIWERADRIRIQLRIELWFYAFLLAVVIAVVAAALALQALISNEAPLAAAMQLWDMYRGS